ncbi:hypothetical protein ACJ2_24840 [Pantoea sp. QMID2]|nr:hypothetical protein ACJ3_28430 [Pantoea sp. QMID3]GME42369.1 hypothetical protein ACJ1_30290 [Pantoea sp. QMID1]GME57545.1 hypothetical protein ACJ4_26790 [Pantoea sp. QMID4]GME58174.1 hypothetical protein ACJ2_24840 [Pantoea sp. QMID2]
MVGSWVEHLRQKERDTINDKKTERRVFAFHQGERSPEVRYLVAPV